MAGILSLMQDHNLLIDAVRMDAWMDVYGSYTFLGHKRRNMG